MWDPPPPEFTKTIRGPQARECTHLVHPFLPCYKWERRPGKLKGELGKMVTHRTRPHCLRLCIVSRSTSELLSKLLFCYNIKEALPFYDAIPSDNKKIATSTQYLCILIPFLKEIIRKSVNNPTDRNFWKKRNLYSVNKNNMKVCECFFPVYSNSNKRMFSSELLQKYLYLT